MIFLRLCFSLLLFSATSATCTEPAGLYLTWQNDPHTTMTICWVTKGKSNGDQIEYQRVGETAWQKGKGAQHPFPDKFGFIVHQVELQGLLPNTDYAFRLEGDNQIYKFRTLSKEPSNHLHFIVGGDIYHDAIAIVTKMNRQAARLSPSFIILGGDLAYNETKRLEKPKQQSRWIDLVASWKSELVTPEGRLIPVLPLIGNHDVPGRWGTNPRNAPQYYALFPRPGYSVFDVGNLATFVLLDSGHTYSVGGAQTQWLDQTLQARRQITHKFAIYHVAAWPSIRHLSGKTKDEIHKYWIPLFEKHGIQHAFEHHDHAYKRTYPLLRDKIDPKGVVYIGDGCWGVEEPRTPKHGYRWYLAKGLPKRNMISVRLHGESRHLIVYDDEGQVLDEVYAGKDP